MRTRMPAWIAGLGVFLIGCATAPKSDVGDWDRAALPPVTAQPTQTDLFRSLGLTARPPEDLGAIEKTFNSCALNPNAEPCVTKFVTLVHFQLLCRDTEGTVSDTPITPEPIATDDVKWNVGDIKGSSRTDDRGYGQLIVLSDRSLLTERLTLKMGARFLGLTVGEITKVVLPSNFCQKR